MDDPFDDPDLSQNEEAEMRYPPPEESAPSSEIEKVRARHEAELLAIEGVNGVAIERNDKGEDVIVAYVRDESVAARMPREIEGYAIVIEITGEFEAY